MSHLYLASPVHVGEMHGMPLHRGRGHEQPGHSYLHLGPAGMGFALVKERDHTIGDYLGDDMLGARVGAARKLVGSRLGLTVRAYRPADILAELFIQHSRDDGSRWRPLRPSFRNGRRRYEIWLGNKLWWSRWAMAGGAHYDDDFTDTDNTVITSHTASGTNGGWSWTSIGFGNCYTIKTNAAQRVVSSDWVVAPALDTLDQFVQVDLDTSGNGVNGVPNGILARANPAGNPNIGNFEMYRIQYNDGLNSGNWATFNCIAGTFTGIGTDTTGLAGNAGDVLRVECNGSSISRMLNGSVQNTATDSNVATYKNGGIGDNNGNGSLLINWASFQSGDLAKGRKVIIGPKP